tara:strand:- start:355 stop:759 length:405 start_codon:yes stop_codon:yes gene_type:complete
MVSKDEKMKKTVEKEEPKKLIEVFAEKPVEEYVNIPKRYYLQVWKKVRPSDSRFDEVAGTVYWSDVNQDILIESLHNNYASEVEELLTGDLILPNGVFVSRNETPKEWIKNAPNATLGYGFYATAFMEIIDETE